MATLPFLVLMNDPTYVGRHANGRFGNAVVVAVIALACVLAVVSFPLQPIGGG